MSNFDFTELAQSYQELYSNYGYSPKSLGWDKGKQFLRFHQLTSDWEMQGTSILDVGCGFGDFNDYLHLLNVNLYNYVGIDLVEDFVREGKQRHSTSNVNFVLNDFLEYDFGRKFDYTIASGTFNSKIDGVDGYDLIYKSMQRMYSLSEIAFSIDFISDKVDYCHEHNFNSSPEKILSFAYEFSRNVVLKNTYFPFEFSITIYTDDSFSPKTTFNSVEKKMLWCDHKKAGL